MTNGTRLPDPYLSKVPILRRHKPAVARGIAGCAAVILLIAGTRWGSYIGGGGVFLTDVLIATAIMHYAMTIWVRPGSLPARHFYSGARPTLLILLLVFIVLRFVGSWQFDLLAVRDAVPYFYAVVGILAWTAVSRSTESQRSRTAKLFVTALGFHAAWFFVVTVLWPGLPELMPSVSLQQSLHLFTPRNDIDTALVGVYAGYLILRVITGATKRPGWYLVGFLLCWVAIFFTGSRAGLIGSLIACTFALICAMRTRGVSTTANGLVVAALPIMFALVMVIAPQTTVGTKMMTTLGLGEQTSKIATDASGTQRARANAWDRMIEWTFEDETRAVVGSGFGKSILSESGADVLLVGSHEVGETKPRSPHNYWVGSLARLGVVGTVLLGLFTFGHVGRSMRAAARGGIDEFTFLVALIPIALLVPATLGVVLESPFGAVPFFWCAGALLATARRPLSLSNEEAELRQVPAPFAP